MKKNLEKSDVDLLSGKILEQLPTPVMAVDRDYHVIYMNEACSAFLGKSRDELVGAVCSEVIDSEHCGTDDCRMKKAMSGEGIGTARNSLEVDGRKVYAEYTAAPLRGEKDEIIGGVEYIVDITELVEKERKLKEQSRTIMDISTPVIKLWDKILVLPIVGVVDSYRAQQMMDTMLNQLKETGSKIIILDIQGVAAVDSAVANHLIKIAKATRLMGCRCILSGISPAVAQTLVHLGIDLGTILTNSNLQEALADAFDLLNYSVGLKA